MARPIKHNWDEIHNYFKAGMPQAEICKKFGISSGRLSTAAKEKGWVVSEEVTERVNSVISAVKAVSELPSGEARAASEIIDQRLKQKELFTNSAMNSQALANMALKGIHAMIKTKKTAEEQAAAALVMLPALDTFGKVTERNKNIVLGKEPDVKIDNTINNTNAQQNNIVKTLDDFYDQ